LLQKQKQLDDKIEEASKRKEFGEALQLQGQLKEVEDKIRALQFQKLDSNIEFNAPKIFNMSKRVAFTRYKKLLENRQLALESIRKVIHFALTEAMNNGIRFVTIGFVDMILHRFSSTIHGGSNSTNGIFIRYGSLNSDQLYKTLPYSSVTVNGSPQSLSLYRAIISRSIIHLGSMKLILHIFRES
jgi:hypothetical protein